MAFATGTAGSFADLKTAAESFLTANGWTLSGTVLSKGAAYVSLSASTYELVMAAGTGASSGALTGACSRSVKLLDYSLQPVSWPVTYELHALTGPDEVYLVIHYGPDRHQHLHFGLSDVPGIGGTGLWFGGSFDSTVVRTASDCKWFIESAQSGSTLGARPVGGAGMGYFFARYGATYPSSYVHCALEGGAGWKTSYVGTTAGALLGPDYAAALLYALPSEADEADVLLPIKTLLARQAQGQTKVAELRHARYVRLDNLSARQNLTYGADTWRVYPLHQRNDVQRDGVNWPTGAQHTGTLGVAIRYTGA